MNYKENEVGTLLERKADPPRLDPLDHPSEALVRIARGDSSSKGTQKSRP